jgi:hypothetical protein
MTISITLLLRSTSIALDSVGPLIGKSPKRFRKKGDLRVAPNGQQLSGVWPESNWSYSWIIGANVAVDVALRMIGDICSPAKTLFANIVNSGGEPTLIIRIYNCDHCGFKITTPVLNKIADLNLNLDVEVFCIPQSELEGEIINLT